MTRRMSRTATNERRSEAVGTSRVERVGRGGLGLCGLATATPLRVLKNEAREATAQENRRWTNTVRPSGLGWGDEEGNALAIERRSGLVGAKCGNGSGWMRRIPAAEWRNRGGGRGEKDKRKNRIERSGRNECLFTHPASGNANSQDDASHVHRQGLQCPLRAHSNRRHTGMGS